VQGHPDQFVVSAFGLSVNGSPSSATGAGAAGPATWSLGVTVDAAGTPGLPQIYSDAAAGAVLPKVTLQFADQDLPGLPTFLTIDLANARIASTATTVDSGLSVALTFAFSGIDFGLEELDAMGAPISTLKTSFDLAANTATAAAASAVTYTVGGAKPGTELASAFVPPSQQTTVDPTGAGAGKVTFSPGTITQSFVDASVLDSISRVALGTNLSDLSVLLLHQQPGGTVGQYMSYDFTDVSELSFGMSGLTSTVSFAYRKIEWTSQSGGSGPGGGGGTSTAAGWDLGQNKGI
jgi:type VI protein secretion system component Hcp